MQHQARSLCPVVRILFGFRRLPPRCCLGLSKPAILAACSTCGAAAGRSGLPRVARSSGVARRKRMRTADLPGMGRCNRRGGIVGPLLYVASAGTRRVRPR